MNANDIILNLPFDEQNGSEKAFDYSQSRSDGDVHGASFVAGNNGNAIQFLGGDEYCELEHDIINTLAGNLTIMAYVKIASVEAGTPKQLIWVVNFGGVKNFIEVPIGVNPGSWYNVAMTKQGTVYRFYVNAQLVNTVTHAGTPTGISLNQDFYGEDANGDCYGLGLLDDAKVYKVALSSEEIINETTTTTNLSYLLDGVDFKEYGVFVAGSDGVVDRPKLKNPYSVNFDNYHGEIVDLNHKFFEPREITLDCFIKAATKNDFVIQLSNFMQQFDKVGTQRLTINVHPVKPLIFEVYCKDAVAVSKVWNNQLMVGTFKVKLTEPEPVKRILKHIRVSEATKTCTMTFKSMKYVNIYWGDGTADFDVAGDSLSHTISHVYAENGDYFPVITGCIDEITDFETNAIIVWNKL
jgi:hypothetical protein